MGLIFRSALPEDLEWENRAEDVALSLDSKDGLTPHYLPIQEPNTFQEPPWLWFTLPELRFPLLTDEYRRPIHQEIEEYMQRYVSYDQD